LKRAKSTGKSTSAIPKRKGGRGGKGGESRGARKVKVLILRF